MFFHRFHFIYVSFLYWEYKNQYREVWVESEILCCQFRAVDVDMSALFVFV